MSETDGHRWTARQYLCYFSVWAPNRDALYVAEIRISRYTYWQRWNFGKPWNPRSFVNEKLPLIGTCLLKTTESKGKSIDHFFGKLKELSKNRDLGNQEDTLTRHLFIANMQDHEIQQELLRETLEQPQALRLAINIELGQRNQLQISKTQPASHVNTITPRRLFCNQTNDKILQPSSDRRINYAEINCASLGQQITKQNVWQSARRAIIMVYRITFHVYFVNRSLHLLNQLVLMLTQLRTIQLNNLLMPS